MINSYHPDWGGDEPLAFDYEWLQERGADAACAEYEAIYNRDGILYVYLAVREVQEGPDAKYSSVVWLGIYNPYNGVAGAYYNPTGEVAPESGKFSLPQYYNSAIYKSGASSVSRVERMVKLMPPEVYTQEATVSYNPNLVICDRGAAEWLDGVGGYQITLVA